MKLIFSEIRENIATAEYHGKPSQTAAEVRAYFNRALLVLVVDCTAQVQRPGGSYRTVNSLSTRELLTVRPEHWQNDRSAAIRAALEIAERFYATMANTTTLAEIANLDATDADGNDPPF